MFQKLAHALHHLFNPHCSTCESLRASELELQREHELESRVCHSCETLRSQLEFQNQLIREMMRTPAELKEAETQTNYQPIRTGRHVPWTVKRAQLQREDKILADKLRKEKEAELGNITQDDLDSELASLERQNAKPA